MAEGDKVPQHARAAEKVVGHKPAHHAAKPEAKAEEHKPAHHEHKMAEHHEHKAEAKKTDVEPKKTELAAAPAKAKGAKAEKEKPKIIKESLHTIGLRDAWAKPRTRRAHAAADVIRAYIRKHTRKEAAIGTKLNELLWAHGIGNPPRHVKVRIQEEEKKATADVV